MRKISFKKKKINDEKTLMKHDLLSLLEAFN